jgi:hypothetical protein
MNVEIGADAALFPEKEYINGIFVAVRYDKFDQSIPWNRFLGSLEVYKFGLCTRNIEAIKANL